jgi:hypothetical protein
LDGQEELMEAATDVCALPGKLKGNDASSTMEALGATLSDMNSRNARRKNTISRETQWQASNRNALGRIKTLSGLTACAAELRSQKQQVIKNMRCRMTDTLFHAGWDVEEANLFIKLVSSRTWFESLWITIGNCARNSAASLLTTRMIGKRQTFMYSTTQTNSA